MKNLLLSIAFMFIPTMCLQTLAQPSTVISTSVATEVHIPTVNQRGMVQDKGGNLIAIYSYLPSGATNRELGFFKSTDMGTTWALLTTAPDFAGMNSQKDGSIVMSADGTKIHCVWIAETSASSANESLHYGVFNLVTETWIPGSVEELYRNTTGQKALIPDIALYQCPGERELPVIAYFRSNYWESFINYKIDNSSWYVATPTMGMPSSTYDFFSGSSIEVLTGNVLIIAGRVREPGGPCGYHNNMFYRKYDLCAQTWLGNETFIHGYTSNCGSLYQDRNHDLWLSFVSEKDVNCNTDHGVYVAHLPYGTNNWSVYKVSGFSLSGSCSTPFVAGSPHHSFAMTSVNGLPTVVFSNGADNYETIYTATWNGAGFDPPLVYYHEPGNTFKRLNSLKSDISCTVVQAGDACGTFRNGLFLSEDCESCSPPSGISVTLLSDSSAEISWTPVVGATGYQVQYRESGNQGSLVTLAPVYITSVVINNLQPGMQYEYRIRAGCPFPNILSDFATDTFITPPFRIFLPEQKLELYPNPVSTELAFTCRLPRGDNAILAVFNAVGDKIYSRVLSDEMKNTGLIDVRKFSPGLYFLQIETATIRRLKKFVKH